MNNFFRRRSGYFVQNLEFGNLLETFLVFAIASLLLIRIYLDLAGYPQLGGSNFHIAHMLWGGLLMMLAIFLLLGFLNKHTRKVAAAIGGVGFGTFIDELGKFITKDNNYFYRPTVALIYIIFILIFFVLKWVEERAEITKMEYAANAIEEIKEVLINDLDETERQKALHLLEKSDGENPLIANLKQTLANIQGTTTKPNSAITYLKRLFKYLYLKVMLTPKFSKVLVTFFSAFAAYGLFSAILDFRTIRDYANWGELISSIIGVLIIISGIQHLLHSKNRIRAFVAFKNAALVSLFLTQFFLFIKDQFSASVGLLISLGALTASRFLIAEEKEAQSLGMHQESQTMGIDKFPRLG